MFFQVADASQISQQTSDLTHDTCHNYADTGVTFILQLLTLTFHMPHENTAYRPVVNTLQMLKCTHPFLSPYSLHLYSHIATTR